MARPDKTIELDRVLDSIIQQDEKNKARSRRLLPPELVEALEYYVRWELAPHKGKALIDLAMPMAREVVEKVREIGIQNLKERNAIGSGTQHSEKPDRKSRSKPPRTTE